ncbi:MAG: T9SS type A sorting domain-containing protein [Saprospiraceae bacterium]|nr:T9SS type A sorting domain-containing protein [Saprospiraceae bacterium]
MKFGLILTTITFLFFITNLTASTYYVSEMGNDTNPGTNSEPWASIQFAIDSASAGDTIAILAGTYYERVSFSRSGVAGMPIILRNAPGAAAIIDGTGTGGQDALIEIVNQSFIEIRGLQLTNNIGADAQGILVAGNCQGIIISNNNISQISFTSNPSAEIEPDSNAQPIIILGLDADNAITGLLIEGNNVHDCITGYSEGIAVNGNVDGFEIVNNKVSNMTNIGIDIIGGEGTASANDQARNGLVKDNNVQNCVSPYATAAGIYVDGGADIVIESNLVTQCQWGIEIGCENPTVEASGIVVKNNFIYDNDDAAIAVGGYDFPAVSGKVINTIIRNNTALGNDAIPTGPGEISGQLVITYTENVEIFNNIFYKTNGADLMLFAETGSSGLSLHHNLYYSADPVEFDFMGNSYTTLDAYKSGAMQEDSSKFEDPLLQSISGGVNFHISSSNSPVINAGDPNTMISPGELDGYEDDVRINNDTIDIGADEFGDLLPVTYLKPFSAKLDGGLVELSWHTAEEIGNDRFDVERSPNSIEWETILQVPAKGRSFAYQQYDASPLVGGSYYRLKQIDLDGSTSFSAIRYIVVKDAELAVFPNPAKDYFQINGWTNEINRVKLFDASGRIQKEWKLAKQGHIFDIETSTPGLYFIQLLDGGIVKNFKLFLE